MPDAGQTATKGGHRGRRDGDSAVSRQVRQYLLGMSPAQACAEVRRFQQSRASPHLERIGRAFLLGYNGVIDSGGVGSVDRVIHGLDDEFGGFVFEGAAMGASLLDLLSPFSRRSRLRELLDGAADRHTYLIHVGAGWALAITRHLPVPSSRISCCFDPLLGWLSYDGIGFYHGYFRWERIWAARGRSGALPGYEGRAFDQGLGRSMWFVHGAVPGAICSSIRAFRPSRHADLWAGVGLACAYAGGVAAEDVALLRHLARGYEPQLAQGAAFAAKARARASHMPRHTETACWILCGTSSGAAAAAADAALVDLRPEPGVPDYESWRRSLWRTLGRA